MGVRACVRACVCPLSAVLRVLEGVEDPDRRPVMRNLAVNLYGALSTSADAGWRNVAVISGVSSNGATRGVWLVDSLTRRAAFLQNPETPGSATLRRVRTRN